MNNNTKFFILSLCLTACNSGAEENKPSAPPVVEAPTPEEAACVEEDLPQEETVSTDEHLFDSCACIDFEDNTHVNVCFVPPVVCTDVEVLQCVAE
jgi:hypothetical protein